MKIKEEIVLMVNADESSVFFFLHVRLSHFLSIRTLRVQPSSKITNRYLVLKTLFIVFETRAIDGPKLRCILFQSIVVHRGEHGLRRGEPVRLAFHQFIIRRNERGLRHVEPVGLAFYLISAIFALLCLVFTKNL